MWLKSDKGEIEVYLCPEEGTNCNSDEGKGDSASTEMEQASIKLENGSRGMMYF